MQAHLRVKEVAGLKGICMAHLQREAKLPVTTVRRYWYNSKSGLERDSGTLSEISLETLATIAEYLGVSPGDLITWR